MTGFRRYLNFSKALTSQVLSSASTFTLVIGLGATISPSEFGLFSLYWAWYMVGLSLSRALVPEVLVIQSNDEEILGRPAFNASIISSSIVSLALAMVTAILYSQLELTILLFAAIWTGSIQDFGRYYLLKQGKLAIQIKFETGGLFLNLLIVSSTFAKLVESNLAIWFLIVCSNLIMAFVTNWHHTKSPRIRTQFFWNKKNSLQSSSFLVDSLVGASFNLWLANLIFTNLTVSELGEYRFLVTYFGISSLLANFTRSGFSANMRNESDHSNYAKALVTLMVLAPLVQLILLIVIDTYSPNVVPIIGQTIFLAPAAALARFFASISSLTLVQARIRTQNSVKVLLFRVSALLPSFIIGAPVVKSFGLIAAFWLDFSNYLLLSVAPLLATKMWPKK